MTSRSDKPPKSVADHLVDINERLRAERASADAKVRPYLCVNCPNFVESHSMQCDACLRAFNAGRDYEREHGRESDPKCQECAHSRAYANGLKLSIQDFGEELGKLRAVAAAAGEVLTVLAKTNPTVRDLSKSARIEINEKVRTLSKAILALRPKEDP